MTLEIKILAWYRHKNVALLMGSQWGNTTSLFTTLLLTGSAMAIHILTSNKNMHRFASTQKDHGTCGIIPYITKMNDNMTRPRPRPRGNRFWHDRDFLKLTIVLNMSVVSCKLCTVSAACYLQCIWDIWKTGLANRKRWHLDSLSNRMEDR